MDLPVSATVHLSCFRDEEEMVRLLRSHGFELTDMGGGRVRVHGYFQQLRAVKVRLERLDQAESSADISASYRAGSSSSPSSSSQDQAASVPPGEQTFMVDPDVFRYAQRLRRGELDAVLQPYGVTLTVQEDRHSTSITLHGKDANMAARSLQGLLQDLSQSLRTQEVTLKDARRLAAPLLEEIRKNRHVHGRVLLRETEDGLHLVGPSGESHELKQRLLGQSAGRTRPGPGRGPGGPDDARRGRSFSETRLNQKKKEKSRSQPPANQSSLAGGGGGASAGPDDARRGKNQKKKKEKSSLGGGGGWGGAASASSGPGGPPAPREQSQKKKMSSMMRWTNTVMSIVRRPKKRSEGGRRGDAS